MSLSPAARVGVAGVSRMMTDVAALVNVLDGSAILLSATTDDNVEIGNGAGEELTQTVRRLPCGESLCRGSRAIKSHRSPLRLYMEAAYDVQLDWNVSWGDAWSNSSQGTGRRWLSSRRSRHLVCGLRW